jgi:hypothetical protein
MKTTEFLKENSIIAQEADTMHKDHEVQMARSQMYNSANAAIEIHKLLKNISEMEGIEGWVAAKLTLANQYLESVRDYLKYEQVDQQSEMMEFVSEAAEYAFDTLLAEDDYDDAVAAFLSKNKPVQGKTHKPRQSERLGGSRHIGGGKEKMKASRTGIGSKPTGKAVAGQASLGEEGYKDWSEKNPGELNKQTADMYDRNTHRWGGDTGVPGAKEHGGKSDLKTVDREGNPVTNRATRIEKPEGVPKVSKKPMTSFGGGGGGGGGGMNPFEKKRSLYFESKQGMSRAANGNTLSPEQSGKISVILNDWIKGWKMQDETFEFKDESPEEYEQVLNDLIEAKWAFSRGDVDTAMSHLMASPDEYELTDSILNVVKNRTLIANQPGIDLRQLAGLSEGEQRMSRAAKGNEKYGKAGMQALAKAGREGASEKELDAIRDKHDKYDESIKEARAGDTNFGSTVGHGSWVVHDGGKVKRFKSRDGAKAYAEKNGGKVASSEFYADNIQSKQAVKENASGGASSAGSIAVSMGGPGHKPTTGVPKKVGNANKSKKVAVGKGIY